MLNYYEVEDAYEGTHIVQVTLRDGAYLGHIAYEMGGNCFGADIVCRNPFEIDNQEDIDRYVVNNCELAYDENSDCYTGALTAADGSRLPFQWSEEEISRRMVGSEIIDYYPE